MFVTSGVCLDLPRCRSSRSVVVRLGQNWVIAGIVFYDKVIPFDLLIALMCLFLFVFMNLFPRDSQQDLIHDRLILRSVETSGRTVRIN